MPPANIFSSNQSEYLFNGCVQGKGYSIGWSLPELIEENNPQSVSELFNLIIIKSEELSNSLTGPMAFNSLDVLTAPLISGTQDESILHEAMSSFFSVIKEKGINLSFSVDLIPSEDLIDTHSAYQAEIDLFNKTFSAELGKMYGNGCFEPSIIINIHNDEAWTHPTLDEYLDTAYMYGQPIIQNKLTSTVAHEATRPTNRDTDIDIPYQRIGGPTGNADNTGVLGYVCVNLAKIGFDANSEDDFFTLLEAQIEESSKILENHRSGFTSTLKEEISFLKNEATSVDWLFSSIVLTGMNEALEYLIAAPLGHVAGKAVTYKVMEFLRRKIEQVQYETGSLYILESFPSETLNDSLIENSGLPNHFLTRGTELPHHHGEDLWDALEHQKKLQSLYTGASLIEVHVKDGLQYNQGCKLLIRRIFDQFGFSYIAVTPSLIPNTEGESVKIIRVDGVIKKIETLTNNYKEVHGKRVHYDVKNK